MKIPLFAMFKARHDLKIHIQERERSAAARERLNLIKSHEKALRIQAENLRKEFDRELNRKLELKNCEIENLRRLVKHLKASFENLHLLSNELSVEFRTASIIAGKSQNRFANIADRVLREAEIIDKKIGKFIGVSE